MLTSSSSYSGGQAYTEQVPGTTRTRCRPATETIIPSAQGALQGTYITGDSYDADTAALSSLYQAAAGGLPTETVGSATTRPATRTLGAATWSYVTSLSYTEIRPAAPVQARPSSEVT